MSKSRPSTRNEQLFYQLPNLSFWYHLGPEAFMRMPNALLDEYQAQLPELIRQYFFHMLQVVTYPHIDDASSRKAIFQTYQPRLDDEASEEVEPSVTKEEYFQNLRTMQAQGLVVEGVEGLE